MSDPADDGDGRDPDEANDRDPDDADDESEWQFTLNDLEQREADAEAAAEAERQRREPLEAGDPSLENTLFVLLGVLLTLFIVSRLFVA